MPLPRDSNLTTFLGGSPSTDIAASIDFDDLAGNMCRSIRAEEQHKASKVRWLANAASGLPLQ